LHFDSKKKKKTKKSRKGDGQQGLGLKSTNISDQTFRLAGRQVGQFSRCFPMFICPNIALLSLPLSMWALRKFSKHFPMSGTRFSLVKSSKENGRRNTQFMGNTCDLHTTDLKNE